MSIDGDGSGAVAGPSGARQMAASLLHPSTLFLIAANWVPVFGVLYWGWDVFVLLVLYWLETAIIGVWTIARIALAPRGTMGPILVNGRPTTNAPLALVAFFLVHSGMFMGVHMLFLWVLFSGKWAQEIHGLRDFVVKLVIGTGLWIPLLILFVVRGVSFLFHELKPETTQRLERSLGLPTSVDLAAPEKAEPMSIIGGFYSRIVIMHLTIIFGAFLATALGSLAPLIIMVGLKTCADVALHLALDFRHAPKVARLVTLPSSR
jgi:hypothetical protein